MIEEWKDIQGYEDYYQVSNLGRVKSLERFVKGFPGKIRIQYTRILKQQINKYGYKIVCLSKEGIKHTIIVHQLVLKSFVLNPKNKRTVNHKNGIKTDNRLNNLEWMTFKENLQDAHIKGFVNNNKKVVMLSLDNNPLLWFDSIKEASKETNIVKSSISMCCRKVRKTAGKYKWEFAGNNL